MIYNKCGHHDCDNCDHQEVCNIQNEINEVIKNTESIKKSIKSSYIIISVRCEKFKNKTGNTRNGVDPDFI